MRLLVRGAPVAELDRLIRILLEHVSPSDEDKEYIRDRLDMAGGALASRNHLLHGTWITATDGQDVILEQKRGFKSTGFRDDEARAIANQLSRAAQEATAALRVASGLVSAATLERMRGEENGWIAQRLLKAKRADPSSPRRSALAGSEVFDEPLDPPDATQT